MTEKDIEHRRLRELAELALLDAPLDPFVDQICRLAGTLFDVPMSYVSLIDATHQHLMASYGRNFGCMAREDAICNLTIRNDAPLIIEDTLAHDRVRRSPLVTGEPYLRFYAGVPLAVSPGLRLGSFCIADTRPRTLTRDQIVALQTLADLVVGQVRTQNGNKALARRSLELATQQQILSQVEGLALIGGFEADLVAGTMRGSAGLRRLFIDEHDEIRTIERFLALFLGGGADALRRGFTHLAEGAREVDVDATILAPGGPREVHVHLAVDDARGGHRAVGFVQDVTSQKAATAHLEWMATHDPLTRVLNRAALTRRVEAAVGEAEASGRSVALIMLDVDRFKIINDSLGHPAGDAVLVEVARRLSAAVGIRGTVARIGGDEFAVLLDRFDAEGAVASVATDVLLALRRPIAIHGTDIEARATLGVALSTSADDLFKDADLALYDAKQAGRDGFAFYRPAMREALDTRLLQIATARDAVYAGRIEPFYQPKVRFDTNEIVGFEALMRWHHPTLGLCGPDAMGDAFVESDLAVAIGRHMIDRVASDMCEWRRRGLSFGHVAINVAEPEFFAGDYAERVMTCLETHRLPPHLLEIEVTESVFLGRRTGNVERALRTLRAHGLGIALDDFGTGYASLTHLKQYPVTSIKIDRSFVVDIETDRRAGTIIEAIMSLATGFGIDVVAEGIETSSQLDMLKARRCAVGQGYLFAKPMAASRVPHFLRGRDRRGAAATIRAVG